MSDGRGVGTRTDLPGGGLPTRAGDVLLEAKRAPLMGAGEEVDRARPIAVRSGRVVTAVLSNRSTHARFHLRKEGDAEQLLQAVSLLTTYYFLFTTYHLLLTTHYLLFTTYYSPLTTYYLLLTTYYSLLTTDYVPLTTYYLLLTTYYSLLTTHYTLHTTYSVYTTRYSVYYLVLATCCRYLLLTTYSSLLSND